MEEPVFVKTKLFGNSKDTTWLAKGSKARPQSAVEAEPDASAPRKGKKRKRTALDRIVALFLVLVTLEGIYCTAAFSNIPFIKKYRSLWIETAMSTMSHHWLATAFFPPAVVKEVTDRMAAARESQIGLSTGWGDEADSTEAVKPEEEGPQFSDDQAAFYELFWELDVDSMEDYVKKNPSVVADGWDHIKINEAGLDDEGTDIYTTEGEQVLAIDAENQVLLLRVTGSGYRGVLAVAKDPSRLSVQVADTLGYYGLPVGDIAQAHNGILAMTASSFIDPDGTGNGGILAGYAMCDGVEYGDAHMGWGNKRIELHENNLMYITDAQSSVSNKTTDAVEFTPALIVDGERAVTEDDFWNGINPRAVIGQSKRYEVLMLVIEGRFTDSIGTGVFECAKILQRHDCMQAMNLDGGTSAILWYDGEYVTRCSNTALPEGRGLPNAFVYASAE